MAALTWAKRVLDVLVDRACILLLAFMTIVVFVSIIFRYVFNFPLAWTEEASRFSFIWVTLLGSVVCLRENSHLGIDLLVKFLPRRLALAVRILGGAVVATTAAVIVAAGLALMGVANTQLSPAIGLPMTMVYVALPVSGILFLVELAWRAFMRLRETRSRMPT